MNRLRKGSGYSILPPQSSVASLTVRSLAMLVLASQLCCWSGCAMPEWLRGGGLDGPNADLGSGLRQSTGNGPWGTGVDERAREIERNLGYRN